MTWIVPNEASIPNDATGHMIRYGKQLLTEIYFMSNWEHKMVDTGYPVYFPSVKPDGTLTGDVIYPEKYSADQHKYGPRAALITE